MFTWVLYVSKCFEYVNTLFEYIIDIYFCESTCISLPGPEVCVCDRQSPRKRERERESARERLVSSKFLHASCWLRIQYLSSETNDICTLNPDQITQNMLLSNLTWSLSNFVIPSWCEVCTLNYNIWLEFWSMDISGVKYCTKDWRFLAYWYAITILIQYVYTQKPYLSEID